MLFKKKPVPVPVKTFPHREGTCIRRYRCNRCKVNPCAMRRKG